MGTTSRNTGHAASQCLMNIKKLVVSVFGDSGSGKTCLTQAMARELGEETACAINADFFSIDRNGRPLHEMTCDFTLLESVIAQPVGTLCHYPEYDFVAFQRIGLKGPLTFRLQKITLIDYMYPYPKADVFIHLDMPFRGAVDRVLQRDPPDWEWRALLAEHWEKIPSVRDSEAVRKLPHSLVLDATLPIKQNVGRAISYIQNAWQARDKVGA